jgi:lactase-phlorizin hydrolase
VKWWLTINEPFMVVNGYSERKGKAPSVGQPGIADYLAVRTILLAHARAYHVYNNEFRKTQQGSTLSLVEN